MQESEELCEPHIRDGFHGFCSMNTQPSKVVHRSYDLCFVSAGAWTSQGIRHGSTKGAEESIYEPNEHEPIEAKGEPPAVWKWG